MDNLTYLAILAGCFLGTLWLEVVLRTRVYRRALRLLLAVVPVAIVFGAWDLYAISAGHWDFDSEKVSGWIVGAGLPFDELLFFFVIPICAVLTFEAVRSVRRWTAGDEAVAPATEPAEGVR